jgi:glycerol-3-phosphate dehydrogenase (NAD(P)+)
LKIAVLGAGAWGTALALQLAKNNHTVHLWDIDQVLLKHLNEQRTNERYLPDIPLPEKLQIFFTIKDALAEADDILLVVPSHAFKSSLKTIKPYLNETSRLAWATKGLTQENQLLHEAVEEIIGPISMAVLSGPTFAKEVAKGLPTAITVAAKQKAFAKQIATCLHSKTFRVYFSDDLIGVEIGGAVKNVLAIAVGIADGMGFGANARCALITRGLVELTRLGLALGGKQETFMGLSGMGDLILTCTDNQSRNRRFGLAIGEGKDRQQALAEIDQVVEGIGTTKAVYNLAKQKNIEMPITEQVYNILYQKVTPYDAVNALLSRSLKEE